MRGGGVVWEVQEQQIGKFYFVICLSVMVRILYLDLTVFKGK